MAELKTITINRRAYYDYLIEETYEAGLVLTGTEIKSVRAGKVNLRDSYVRVIDGELWLWNAHISPYEPGTRYNHEPTRSRKLLMHRDEMNRLISKVQRSGYTLVPTKLYIKNDVAKIEVGLARGKKTYDKREAIAEREAQRDIERALKRH